MPTGDGGPLAGVRVVDSTDEHGELGGRLLADLGADVIRVEPPGGTGSRRLPPLGPDGTSLWFAVRNTNKRSVTLDTAAADTAERDRARERLHELLAGADAWIEGHRPGTLAGAIGVDHDELRARHPHLVVVSVTDFGLTGPYRDFVGTDDVMVAMGGLLFRSGTQDRPPLLPPGSLASDATGVAAAFATLTALWQRRATGRGQHVDLSVLESVAQITDWSLPNWAAMVRAGRPYMTARSGSGLVYPIYPCADGHVRVVILSVRQWRAMREWLGDPEVVQDPHWDQLLNRMSIQEDILDPLYIELFARYTAADLAAEAQRRGIVMTPLITPSAVLTTPHFVERGTFVDAEAAPGVRGAVASGYVEVDGERAGYRHRAPAPGEHDSDVLDTPSPPPNTRPGTQAPGQERKPFAGLHVLDMGHGGVGVEAARQLGDYGADVVKLESRTYPDFIRQVGGTMMSPSFASSSRGKRSFGLDLKHPRAPEVIERLVRWADVVIENTSTGTMADLGLDHDSLLAVNPRVVMASSQLMGSSGPWKDWIGYGPSTRPAGGMTYLWNWPEGGAPPGAGVIHPDHLVGRIVALAALAALLGREAEADESGDGDAAQGRHVEVAQVETLVNLLADLFLRESLVPGSVGPEGNTSQRGAPWGVYPCASPAEERWCVVTVRDDEDWRGLRRALGDPEWARRPELDTAEGRQAARAELDEHIAAWTTERTDREVMALLQAEGVPAGFMSYPADQVDDEHYRARGYAQEVDQPGVGSMVMEGPAFTATDMDDPVGLPAPGLGEHTREICRESLGMDDAEIDDLVAAGVLEEPDPPAPAPTEAASAQVAATGEDTEDT
jgi:crotonobetainyl-CoA:carnitine CoA-transferase CaiB-like acyl-CoA transferase